VPRYIETYRAIVAPAQCDQVGHLNLQYYMAAFSDSMFAIAAHLGLGQRMRQQRRMALPAVHMEIDFRRELLAGDAYCVAGTVESVGTKSLTTLHRMSDVETGEVVAEARVVSACMDLDARASRPLADDIAAAARAMTADGDS